MFALLTLGELFEDILSPPPIDIATQQSKVKRRRKTRGKTFPSFLLLLYASSQPKVAVHRTKPNIFFNVIRVALIRARIRDLWKKLKILIEGADELQKFLI